MTCAEEDTLVTLERKMAPQKEAKRMPTNASKVDTMVMPQQLLILSAVADVPGKTAP
jgi:hypothetical protein